MVTAVAYINHQGGTRSCAALREANLILLWADGHIQILSAVYITGVDSWQMDFQSSLPGCGVTALSPQSVLGHLSHLGDAGHRTVSIAL